MSFNGASVMAATVVAVDVGKNRAALSIISAYRHRSFGPAGFVMPAPALTAVLERVWAVLPAGPVKVGVEAAGHYHRPLLGSGVWPAGWEVLGPGPAASQDRRHRFGGDHRIGAGRPRGPGHGPGGGGHRARWVGDAPWPPGSDTDRNEESVARSAGPLLSRANGGVA